MGCVVISTTGWVLRTWLKFTVLLALVVGGVWLWFGTGSGWFWTAAIGAGLVEWALIRQLAREWAWQARGEWWWAR